ncbi:MAG TPA: thioredoxin [Spirochaetota bacterium]|jgi:thioredoxin 1|nr:thioredoxin [Spirochaetota bacterium]OPZ39157.1 MAG: Thioredoxin-1 [Spirochaetes bacterium ADurb.BinA120]HNU92134.1 thioredoxin [Spirochaetota bacterium]HPI14727.1 thioredoxin [Spirochaetota bacterium]HPO44770.1 thioredoxin [Spirochaetota bacterium]
MSTLTEVTDGNFSTEVLGASGAVLVDFWAPWCGPCRMQTPILEGLARELNGNARIVKLNTDENPATARNFGINSIPTLILFKDGKEVERMVGVQPAESLKRKLQ